MHASVKKQREMCQRPTEMVDVLFVCMHTLIPVIFMCNTSKHDGKEFQELEAISIASYYTVLLYCLQKVCFDIGKKVMHFKR